MAWKGGTSDWFVGTNWVGDAVPAAGDDVLYAASRKGEVHALDAATGRTRWVSDT